jgi:hypothetical protein
MPRGPVRRSWRPVGLVAAGTVVLSLMRAAAAEDIPDWPCEQPYVERLALANTGEAWPFPASWLSWLDYAEVRRIVTLASDPENPAARGIAEIEAFKATDGMDQIDGLALVLAGILDETNSLRAFLLEGIRANVVKARVLQSVVADNDAALAALPAGGAEADAVKREEVTQARFWNMRSLDEAKDGAELLCRRLAYLDRKTRTLADAVRARARREAP